MAIGGGGDGRFIVYTTTVTMKTTFDDRRFQFWQYRVSHGELLVRSPKDAAHPRNVDLMRRTRERTGRKLSCSDDHGTKELR
jgi:hypothetical protein